MTTLYCPICGEPMHTYEQRDYRKDRTSDFITVGECREEGCPFYYITASQNAIVDGSTIAKWGMTSRFDVLSGQPLALCA